MQLNYDYETFYDSNLPPGDTDLIEDIIRHSKGMQYAAKTIKSGSQLECEIYPVFPLRHDLPRAKRSKPSKPSQRNLNDKNAKKYAVRLLNENFTCKDIWITTTYDDTGLPQDEKQAFRNAENFIRRLCYYRQKHSLPPLRYFYVTEYRNNLDGNGEKSIRVHHHFVLSGDMDRDMVEQMWNKGGRREARRLQPDDFGLTVMAIYLCKDPKGAKRWRASRNLKAPKTTVSYSRFRKRRIERMVKNQNEFKSVFEKEYPGYMFTDQEIHYNDINSAFYLYVRMRREDRAHESKRH